MSIDVASIDIDLGATRPMTAEAAPTLHNLPEQPKEEKRKVGLRQVAIDVDTMQRITEMLIAHSLDKTRFPQLRRRDIPHLEKLADIWSDIYDPVQGAAYSVSKNFMNPHVITETAEGRLARITQKMQAELQKIGMKLSYVRPREGSLNRGFTKPYLEVEYKNPFQALRMKGLLRRPSENRSHITPSPIVQKAA